MLSAFWLAVSYDEDSNMILRPRQKEFVKNCCDALKEHKNTLGIANTGFGKTVALSAIIGKRIKNGRALILAHRDELTNQNSNTFSLINPGIPVSFFNARKKSFRGQAVFSMIQTLSKNIERIPHIDMLVIDEAHHSASISYKNVINHVKEKNPKLELLGVTATPERSDRKGLKDIYSNVADVVTIGEMVTAGHLVPPKAMVIDIGTQEALRGVKKTANDYNQSEVEAIQNTQYNNDQIVSKWLELAKDRKTVVFCSTIQHAIDVCNVFRDAGIDADFVHGQLGLKERRAKLAAFDRGEIPVLCNPMILTEGWDSPRCDCVVLLRTSSHKSTMIQMVGRGLRKVDPKRYPGVIKKDCLVLDFGISLLVNGDLNADVKLRSSRKRKEGEAVEIRKKDCPNCSSKLPVQTETCPLCGYVFKVQVDDSGFYDEVQELKLIEIELINKSPFKWVNLFPSEKILITSGFDSWASVCSPNNEDWYAIGSKGKDIDLIDISNKTSAIASADDFMRQNESSRSAKKAAKWMYDPASQKQQQLLNRIGYGNVTMSKVEAAAHLTFKFNQKKIEKLIGV